MNIFANDICLRYFAIPKWLAKEFLEKTDAIDNKPTIKCLLVEDKNNTNHKCQKNKTQKELLAKMLSAININIDDFKCIAIDITSLDNTNYENLLSSYKTSVIVLLANNSKCSANNVFLCPHPYNILQDTTLKRLAWNVLQKIKLQIK